MADSTTPVVAPGETTTEYKATKLAMWLGYAAFAVGLLMDVFVNVSSAFPNLAWVGPVLNALGIISAVLAQLGYNKGRVLVKTAALNATTVTTAALNATTVTK